MPAPRKIDVVETERLIVNVTKGVYDVLMIELEARNKRLGDKGDPVFFGDYAYQLLSKEFEKERLDAEREKKTAKDGKGDAKPHLVPQHQQSA